MNFLNDTYNGQYTYTEGHTSYVNITALDTRFIRTGSNVSFEDIRASGDVWVNDTLGRVTNVNNLIQHLEDMSSDTLLDSSRSSLSCVGGVLNYTLYAIDGVGDWNFDGKIYAGPGVSVANATITLLNGTAISPVTNYIYFELVGDVPTLKTSSIYPTSTHIDVATFVVGEVTGTTANIYSYSRNRYEVDSFVNRVIQRFEDAGTLYVSGFTTGVNTTSLNVSSGGEFFNGIFKMTSTNNIKSQEGFYYINSSGNFVQATSLTTFTQYADGTAMTGANLRVNIVWGLVAINTTGGLGPTQMRLVAVLPNPPVAAYNDVATAQADIYGTTNYYPPNAEIKNTFVPIARTILRPNTDLFEPFASGKYFKDIRGAVTTGGSAPSAASSDPIFNSISIINANYLYNAISVVGNINSYFQFNIQNKNISPSASSDLVATSPIGSETSYYVDLGINGPTYNDTNYAATKGNDSYLLTMNSSLIIGTGSVDKYISFFVNSFMTPIWVMNITSTGLNMFKNLDMGSNNITNVSYIKLNEISGACDLTINGSICKNSTGLYITGLKC